jgi:hypothetical protein
VVRTNLPAAQSDAAATVRAYKGLAVVERAFRSMKTVDLDLQRYTIVANAVIPTSSRRAGDAVYREGSASLTSTRAGFRAN